MPFTISVIDKRLIRRILPSALLKHRPPFGSSSSVFPGMEAPMNREKITFMQCRNFRIRPIAKRIGPNGRELSCIDDLWRVLNLTNQSLRLVNVRTNHIVTFGLDCIEELITEPRAASSGCLVLKNQIILKGSGVYLELLNHDQQRDTLSPSKLPSNQTSDVLGLKSWTRANTCHSRR